MYVYVCFFYDISFKISFTNVFLNQKKSLFRILLSSLKLEEKFLSFFFLLCRNNVYYLFFLLLNVYYNVECFRRIATVESEIFTSTIIL